MQTILLSAGVGTRMRPLTEHRAKPMLPAGDRPLAAHVLDAAAAAGATRFTLVVGYDAANVREYFGDSYAGVPVTYVEQSEQRGTAHAVRSALSELSDAPFAVLNGDTLYDEQSMKRLFEAGPAVGSFRVDDPTQYGVLRVEETERGDRVTGVVEKPKDPPSDRINAGAYVFPAVARKWLDVSESERGELELTDTLARACEETTVTPVSFDRWLDVGRPWELLAANEWVIDGIERRVAGDVHPDADVRGNVVVEEEATIDSGVVVEGPVIVRSGAVVGPNAYVRGRTLIGEDATVGHAVEVKNSVLMEGATVSHQSYVGDSVLGRNVNFGAGTNVANLRHDGANVLMTVKGERISTGRRKFGVVCGDRAKTGIETAFTPGVKMSAGSRTKPGEVVTRDK